MNPIEQYIEAHTTPESDLLKKIHRETYLKVLMPHMISGHLQGRVLATFASMLQARRILEIGTFTGYSTICLAEGLTEDGYIYTIDINEELAEQVKKYFNESPYPHKFKQLVGNALELIKQIDDEFDLVFIDADKRNYSAYYDLVIDKVRKGGLIIADNVLWHGKIADEKINDKDTLALRAFNDKVHQDSRVNNLLLAVRDGLMIM